MGSPVRCKVHRGPFLEATNREGEVAASELGQTKVLAAPVGWEPPLGVAGLRVEEQALAELEARVLAELEAWELVELEGLARVALADQALGPELGLAELAEPVMLLEPRRHEKGNSSFG
uniref:Uncharacterized protein n=1 Tax=Sphaerodactylus townsendi TaxID=933632 RepID=A0ACB8FC72_9SAUR